MFMQCYVLAIEDRMIDSNYIIALDRMKKNQNQLKWEQKEIEEGDQNHWRWIELVREGKWINGDSVRDEIGKLMHPCLGEA